MKFLKRIHLFIFLICYMAFHTVPIMADIPYELKFSAVFNMSDQPITGTQSVTVRLFSNNEVVYREVVKNVVFYNGVADVVIGGQNTSLINSIFDDPQLEVSLSVLQHKLHFAINSVPYTIRSKESNKARRVDNEQLVKFIEPEQRVGISILNPEVSLDVSGTVRVMDILPSGVPSNGVFYWDGNKNQFRAYIDGGWESMSWIPEPEDRSKWVLYPDPLMVESLKSVGIGIAPNSYALAVTKNAFIKQGVIVKNDLDIFGSAVLPSGLGFLSDGSLLAPSLSLIASGNTWHNGDLNFKGVLSGDGSGLTNLNHFGDNAFSSQYFENGVILSSNFYENSVQSHHIAYNTVQLVHLVQSQITGNLIEDFSLTASEIATGAIQAHHMKKNQFASADIINSQFLKKKFKNDSIQSYHVVDGDIIASKIAPGNILSEHFSSSVITTSKIRNEELKARHVPLQSIPISNYDDVVAISRGGTGQVQFDNYGIVFGDSQGNYSTDLGLMSFKDGLIGFGGMPHTDSLVVIQNPTEVRMGVRADDESVSRLLIENSVSSWNFYVDSFGDFNIGPYDQLLLKFTSQGNVGVHNTNPSEALSLNGPIVLGGAISSGVPGSIRYHNDQFWVYNQFWSAITASAISYRDNTHDFKSRLISSTVISADDSIISGKDLLVRSVNSSSINGFKMDLNEVDNSTIDGDQSAFSFVSDTTLSSQLSGVEFISDSDVVLHGSNLAHVTHLDGKLNASRGYAISHSSIDSNKADLNFLNHVKILANTSQIQMVDNGIIQGSRSDIGFSDHLDVVINGSNIYHSDFINGHLLNSNAFFLNGVTANVSFSRIQNSRSSQFNGDNHLIFGGDHHDVSGRGHIALKGSAHRVKANQTIGIGDHLIFSHDNTTLINTADKPLHSDRDGQIKIQAAGGLEVRFSDDQLLAFSPNTDGWGVISDESLKMSKVAVDSIRIIERFRQLPIQYWVYKNQQDVQHIGPTAQDFYRLFNYGNSDTVIHGIDSDGVLLATIQGIYQQLSTIYDNLDSNVVALKGDHDTVKHYSKTLTELSKKITLLDRQYNQHLSMLGQLKDDNKTQNQMIDYIDSAMKKLSIQDWLNRLDNYLLSFIFIGIVMGVLIVKIRQRRGAL